MRTPRLTLSPYTTLFRSPQEHHRRLDDAGDELGEEAGLVELVVGAPEALLDLALATERLDDRVAGEGLLDLGVEGTRVGPRSEEHTSELQSRENLVCRLL